MRTCGSDAPEAARFCAACREALGDTGRPRTSGSSQRSCSPTSRRPVSTRSRCCVGSIVSRQAPSLSQPGSYLEPFALRALGIVRDDAALLARSGELFATLGLDWHAAQTDALAA